MTRAKDISKILTDADISGDIDVDGTTNLDVVDIDGAVDFASTTAHAGNATFGDNAKAIFGDGSDLQIYHDGSKSYIQDTGTGDLYIQGSNQVRIGKAGTYENGIVFNEDNAVQLYYDASEKLATTSTGIDVTGTATMDGISVDGGAVFNEASADVDFRVESNGNANMLFVDGGNDSVLMGGTETVVYADTSGNQLEYATYFALKRETANSSQAVAYINNTGADGNIIDLRKDGTTVGTIGTNSGYMVIGSPVGTDAHLLIGNGLIHPAISTGGAKDNAIDIGGSSNRFKDLYLSGGAFIGGTGASNKLEDYEEGSFTLAGVSSGYTLIDTAGFYTKIGRQVTVIGHVKFDPIGTNNSYVSLSGLPFASANLDANVYYPGVAREDVVAGDIFVVQVNKGASTIGMNPMDGVTPNSNQNFVANRSYSFAVTYFTT
ncbi:hypothetical protein OAI36_00305 [Alphaproteobacteria bacterium]|nr:hypothetical protein [Alphaproteobacteria bacterium]